VSNSFRTRLPVEEPDARITPSAAFDAPPAFTGLDVAVTQFYPTDRSSPATVSPVFVLNYNLTGVEVLPALTGLQIAGTRVPPNLISPVFVGLGHGSVDTPA
jgi:hypothetical protein